MTTTRRITRLVPHAIGLGLIAVLVISWDLLGMVLPPLDVLLAPGGGTTVDWLAAGGVFGARALGVLVLPGLLGVLVVDAILVSVSRPDRRSEHPERGAG